MFRRSKKINVRDALERMQQAGVPRKLLDKLHRYLSESDEGGLFQYVPDIRSPEHEPYDEVAAVLAGRSERVVTLDLRPGDLQIFRGRYSIHRVTRVGTSSRPRHAAIFAYTEDEGVIGRLERTRQLFGRALPVHEHAEEERVRHDALRD